MVARLGEPTAASRKRIINEFEEIQPRAAPGCIGVLFIRALFMIPSGENRERGA
jgi:hypothetical protein